MRILCFLLMLGLSPSWANEPTTEENTVDNILVEKGARKLYLRHGETVVREYKIALGFSPEGNKEREGDGRTPEGKYTISGRNPKSAYHLSLRISYPNAEDRKRAAAKNVSPGGDIMIHGFPNRSPNFFFKHIHNRRDWTAGCIAVTDKEIEEIWKLTPDNTPIEIKP